MSPVRITDRHEEARKKEKKRKRDGREKERENRISDDSHRGCISGISLVSRPASPRPTRDAPSPVCTGTGSGRRECNAHRPRCTAGPPDACMHPRRVTLVFYRVKHRGGCVGRFTRAARFRGKTGGPRERGPAPRRERYSRYSNARAGIDVQIAITRPGKAGKDNARRAFYFSPNISSIRFSMFNVPTTLE